MRLSSPRRLSRRRLRREPGQARRADAADFVVVEETDAAADHAEDAAGEKVPRFGVDVAVGVEDAFLLPEVRTAIRSLWN